MYYVLREPEDAADTIQGSENATDATIPTKIPTRRPTPRPTDPENLAKDACIAYPNAVWFDPSANDFAKSACSCEGGWKGCRVSRAPPCCLHKTECYKEAFVEPKYGFTYVMEPVPESQSTICKVAGALTNETENMRSQCIADKAWSWASSFCRRKFPTTFAYISDSFQDHGDGFSFRLNYPGTASFLQILNAAEFLETQYIVLSENSTAHHQSKFCNRDIVLDDLHARVISGSAGIPEVDNPDIRTVFLKKSSYFSSGVATGSQATVLIRMLVKRGSGDNDIEASECIAVNWTVQSSFDMMCSKDEADAAPCLPEPSFLPFASCGMRPSDVETVMKASRCLNADEVDDMNSSIRVLQCDGARDAESAGEYLHHANFSSGAHFDCDMYNFTQPQQLVSFVPTHTSGDSLAAFVRVDFEAAAAQWRLENGNEEPASIEIQLFRDAVREQSAGRSAAVFVEMYRPDDYLRTLYVGKVEYDTVYDFQAVVTFRDSQGSLTRSKKSLEHTVRTPRATNGLCASFLNENDSGNIDFKIEWKGKCVNPSINVASVVATMQRACFCAAGSGRLTLRPNAVKAKWSDPALCPPARSFEPSADLFVFDGESSCVPVRPAKLDNHDQNSQTNIYSQRMHDACYERLLHPTRSTLVTCGNQFTVPRTCSFPFWGLQGEHPLDYLKYMTIMRGAMQPSSYNGTTFPALLNASHALLVWNRLVKECESGSGLDTSYFRSNWTLANAGDAIEPKTHACISKAHFARLTRIPNMFINDCGATDKGALIRNVLYDGYLQIRPDYTGWWTNRAAVGEPNLVHFFKPYLHGSLLKAVAVTFRGEHFVVIASTTPHDYELAESGLLLPVLSASVATYALRETDGKLYSAFGDAALSEVVGDDIQGALWRVQASPNETYTFFNDFGTCLCANSNRKVAFLPCSDDACTWDLSIAGENDNVQEHLDMSFQELRLSWTCEDNCGNAGVAAKSELEPGGFLALEGGTVRYVDFKRHSSTEGVKDQSFQRASGSPESRADVLTYSETSSLRDIFWHLQDEGIERSFYYEFRDGFSPHTFPYLFFVNDNEWRTSTYMKIRVELDSAGPALSISSRAAQGVLGSQTYFCRATTDDDQWKQWSVDAAPSGFAEGIYAHYFDRGNGIEDVYCVLSVEWAFRLLQRRFTTWISFGKL